MPAPDMSDAALISLLQLAEKVRNAPPKTATSYISILPNEMARAVLQELLETRESLAQVLALAGRHVTEKSDAAALQEVKAKLLRARGGV